jgi:hypothetical protein
MTFHSADATRFEATAAAALRRATAGSHDGEGAGDHDVPFTFGWRPRLAATYPFSTRQYARLLVLRSRIQAMRFDAEERRVAQPA